MKATSTCCGGAASAPCDNPIAELPRYYPRQLITPDDLTLEQNYFRDRMRRHNRLIHGWGVVCGALVCPITTKASDGTVATAPWQVQVQEGYALGPYGDEIILDCKRTIDLRGKGCTGVTGEPCLDMADPWCSQVFANTGAQTIFYVAVKYKQSQTRPVRVQPVGCGCDDTACEYSRWTDGYEIGILPACPDSHQNQPSLNTNPFQGDVPTCPDCPDQPWVVLAVVNVDGDGNITSIDNCSCRRLVFSASQLWWRCSGTVTITGVTGSPVTVTADGKTTATAVVTGTNLNPYPIATYTLGNGITIQSAVDTSDARHPLTSVTLTVVAETSAATGDRTLTIVNTDCSVAIWARAVTVVAPAQGAFTRTAQALPKDVTVTPKATKKADTTTEAAPPAPAADTAPSPPASKPQK